METYCFTNINYTYPGCTEKALEGVSFDVRRGEFLAVCGASGSGKSTLLRCLKERYPEFGIVLQNPSSQIVTDKVYHELAFGMENQGISPEKMNHAIAETATYFGIEGWMERDTFCLSGGEMQILNLASAVVMDPEVILLDEPTAQLDPMAAQSFMDMLRRLNTQSGITVIIVEQRLEEVLSLCDRMLVLRHGKLAVCDTVSEVFRKICRSAEMTDEFLCYMPSFVRLYHHFSEEHSECPKNIRECRQWFMEQDIHFQKTGDTKERKPGALLQSAVRCKNVFFRYEKKERDVLKEVCYEAVPGRIYGIAGGNGSGKSTFLKILSGAVHAYHGAVTCTGEIAYLPQEPKYLFLEDKICDIIKSERAIQKFGLSEILDRHPYDVSGGQMQRVAMAYLYEKDAEIYLFDEPTKGLDPQWKRRFRDWLSELAEAGRIVIVVSHDVEFAANACEYMSMCFDSRISEPMPTEEFFKDNLFYTTAVHRIVRERYPDIVAERFLYED